MSETIGKAYVQVLPSTKGFAASLSGEVDTASKSAGDKGGESAGVNFAKKMLSAIAAAGIAKKLGDIVKGAVEAGGALEQSMGGIEALYGEESAAAKYLVRSAQDAYKTVGISANDYMENVTSFSAALLNGLGGDTNKAAKIANQAMIDMGDNVNRFGTDMESVQNAIMGLSRGNYTMLDNLKLGFAGTQQGMIDLINASGVMGKEIESLDGVTFDQMLSAIHEVQKQLNVTGTTANEADTTLQGSLSAMQSAWTNLQAAMATGENLDGAMSAMGETLITFGQNLIPMIGNVLSALPNVFSTVLSQMAANFDLGEVTDAIIAKIEQLPDLIGQFATWLQAKADGEGDSKFGEAAGRIILALGRALIASLPAIFSALDAGFQMLVEFIGSLGGRLLTAFDTWINTSVLPKGREMVTAVGNGICAAWDSVKTAAAGIVTRVNLAISAKMGEILTSGKNLVSRFISGVRSSLGGLASAGMDIVRGIWQGISGGLDWIKNLISGWVGNVKDFIKRLFGIASPSKWAADTIGAMLPAGIAVGIEDNTGVIDSAMSDLREAAYDGFNMPALNQSINYTAQQPTVGGGVTVNVYGAQHQNERAIADYVIKVITGDIEQKGLAYA